ncbi:asparagine synthase (glutamine-hydrolyzing) [Candidatus Peregrinibacteria bacterium]|nr:asparagine synthase (glutamine-hydrolyzing) [Candidatus Peregrinibacteria bacterium]
MCGINGIINLNGQAVIDSVLQEMNSMINHRGPDDQGVFVDDNVGLGHTRLSILDLSKKGHQPMEYEHRGRKVVITYNGEVYNFKELREELEQKGYAFNSNTDTEVLLASYLEDGIECIKKWNGMFSFVIYDPQKNILFGARDRFGQKPLKYYQDNQRFIFSSELKAILQCGISREVDYSAIDDFLTLQYVPAPRTGFKKIWKLPAAHYFFLDLRTKKFETQRYFDLDYSKKLDLTEQEWMERIESELDRSVKMRLVADVPLGAFLSGGIDSSAIVAMMSKYVDRPKTFTIAFGEKEYDESQYARQVADLYNTDHNELLVQSSDLLDHIEDLVMHYEEPYADSSALPTFLLSKLTKKHVTVALSGDGGDENFGGYDKHRRHVFLQRYLRVLPAKRMFGAAGIWLKKLPHNEFCERLSIFLRTLDEDIGRRHYNFTSYFDEFTKQEMCTKDFLEQTEKGVDIFDSIIAGKQFAYLDKIFYIDFDTYLPDDLNVKVDMASMKYGLEVRSPMLDHQFVSTMAQMPWEIKTSTRSGKMIFKKALEKHLPKEILYRKKKGFGVPLDDWFRGPLKEYVREKILRKDGIVFQIMREPILSSMLDEHDLGKRNHGKKLWTLMALNMWHNNYFR